METLILTDPMTDPDQGILEKALGKKYKLFTDFTNKINEQNMVLEWHYYNDSKSWLCKILLGKKNHGWLSVWNTGFKLTFFFTEKTVEGVRSLEISDEIKEGIGSIRPVGKLRPIILLATNKSLMKDGIKILDYKAKLK